MRRQRAYILPPPTGGEMSSFFFPFSRLSLVAGRAVLRVIAVVSSSWKEAKGAEACSQMLSCSRQRPPPPSLQLLPTDRGDVFFGS